jgi:hypothetical protein
MLFPLYLAVLSVSAGIAGVFGRRLAAQAGFVPDFHSGLAVAAMVACSYIVLQCGYSGLIQLLKPHRGKGPYLTEYLSLAAALVLLPFLLNVPIPWPHPKLAELEPVIYLGLFASLHGFFKLATLFAATQAPPATPMRAVPFAVVTFLALIGAQIGFSQWHASLQGLRMGELPPVEPLRIGDTYASVRALSEGLHYTLDQLPGEEQHLTFRWTNSDSDGDPIEAMHVTCTFFGASGDAPLSTLKETLTLSPDGWLDMRMGADVIPEGATSFRLAWALNEEPAWMARTGLRPAQLSSKAMLLSGPYLHHDPKAFERPNIVVLLVEGLGADHMGLYGYERETAPRFTELAKRSTVWENAFTACPDTYSTTVSLFTGLQPLAHRNTGTDAVPLPEETPYLPALMAEAGYATVAFTEGEGPDGKDLVYESGLARGFEHFNPAFPQVPLSNSAPGPMVPKGARETLQRAAEWIQEHRELERYFVFIRLRELRKPLSLARYETPPWENFSRGIDVYDAAVLDVDKQIGLFVERLKEMGSLEDTCLLITSPYGLDFSEPERAAWRRGAKGVPRLTEESARVPLLLSMPEGVGRTRRGLVSLTTMGPTLASLAGVRLSKGSTEASLLEYTPSEDPVTVYGDPVALSVRTMEWRLNWNSGLKAADLSPVAPGHILGLYSLAEYKEKKWAVDMQGREPELSRRLAAQLEAYTSRVTTTGDAPR